MKSIKYSRHTGEDWDSLSIEELLNKLSDFLLQSGFNNPYFDDFRNSDRDLQALHDALLNALLRNRMLPDEMLQEIEKMQDGEEFENSEISRLVQYLIDRLAREGYIRIQKSKKPVTGKGGRGLSQSQVRFELTDKALDFLGYKTLKNLLGSLGKSSFGRHDTRDMATGVEASGASRQYEFGDTLNLDITATLSSAIQREGLELPLNIEYRDLQVHQCEYQSSCATVLMLDCSHSMILYGEDRR